MSEERGEDILLETNKVETHGKDLSPKHLASSPMSYYEQRKRSYAGLLRADGTTPGFMNKLPIHVRTVEEYGRDEPVGRRYRSGTASCFRLKS